MEHQSDRLDVASYITVTHAHLEAPQSRVKLAGRELARSCLDGLRDEWQEFPPRLFILLATCGWGPFADLLNGVRVEARDGTGGSDVPLVGTTVSACIFDGAVHEQGVLLVCLGSEYLKACTGWAGPARCDPSGATRDLLEHLGVARDAEVNPMGRQFLLTFLPGFDPDGSFDTYMASEIHHELRRQTNARIPIVGGVSSTVGAEPGRQFCNDDVLQDSVVSALLRSDVKLGLGMRHGLVPGTEAYRVVKPADATRKVTVLDTGPPAKTFAYDGDLVFGVYCGEHDASIHSAKLGLDGALHFQKELPQRAGLVRMVAEGPNLVAGGQEAVGWAVRRARLNWDLLSTVLVFACAARYGSRKETGLDPVTALADGQKKLGGLEVIGAYFDGELGLDNTGRSVFGTWCVSSLVLSDELAPRSRLYRGLDAFATVGEQPVPTTMKQAVSSVLYLAKEAGFPGAMVSLVMESGEGGAVIAQDAIGKGWPEIVGITRRPFGEGDILAEVWESGKARDVFDCFEDGSHCDLDTCLRAGVVSQRVAPLLDEDGRVAGIIQLDLGDLRCEHAFSSELSFVADGVVGYATASLRHAAHAEELEFTRELDDLLEECLVPRSGPSHQLKPLESALKELLVKAAGLLGFDMAHVRLWDAEKRALHLVCGMGPYYEKIKGEESGRQVISIDDKSPTTMAFVRGAGTIQIVNDAQNSPSAQLVRDRYEGTKVGRALTEFQSFANTVLGGPDQEVAGTLNVGSSTDPWHFTGPRANCLRVLASRARLLVRNLTEQQTRRQVEWNLKSITTLVPQLEEGRSLGEALAMYVSSLKEVFDPDTVSCYLWDDERQRYVLRACQGWHDDRWVDAASYREDEGLTGGIASASHRTDPEVIYDVVEHKRNTMPQDDQPGKWARQMFGFQLDGKEYTADMIALPLKQLGGGRHASLGIVTLHWLRHPKSTPSFNLPAEDALRSATDALNAVMFAQVAMEDKRWREQESGRFRGVEQALRLRDEDSVKAIIQRGCEAVVSHYALSACAAFLASCEDGPLDIVFQNPQGDVDIPVPGKDGDDIVSNAHWRWKEADRYPALIEERMPKPLEGPNPEPMRLWNSVEAVALRTQAADDVLILCMRWRRTKYSRGSPGHPIRHDLPALKELAERIGAAVAQQKAGEARAEILRLEADRNQALTRFGAAWSLAGHGALSFISDIGLGLEVLMKALRGQPLAEKVEDLRSHTEQLTKTIEGVTAKVRQFKDPKIEVISLRRLVEVAVGQSVRSQFDSGGALDVEVRCPDGVVGRVDRNLFDLALRGPLDNACEAIRGGPEPGRLTVTAQTDEDHGMVHVRIEDSGPGLTRPQFESALGGGYTSKKALGHGIGLALSSIAAEAMNGKLYLDETYAAGTAIVMTVPSA